MQAQNQVTVICTVPHFTIFSLRIGVALNLRYNVCFRRNCHTAVCLFILYHTASYFFEIFDKFLNLCSSKSCYFYHSSSPFFCFCHLNFIYIILILYHKFIDLSSAVKNFIYCFSTKNRINSIVLHRFQHLRLFFILLRLFYQITI